MPAAAPAAQVALLAEGVDRNAMLLTARCRPSIVALLAEGVDRNAIVLDDAISAHGSPSSQRAWIEIFLRTG